MRTLLIIFLVGMAGKAIAQQQPISFDFTSEDENRLVKENDSLKYYVANGDTSNTVALNDDDLHYRLINKDGKTIVDGSYIEDGDKYIQNGKWTEKYDNGHIHKTGCYKRGLPIGTWQEYYNTGKLKGISNYGCFIYKGEPVSCLSGTWLEYYPDGQLKVSGFYGSIIYTYKDTILVADPVSGENINKTVSHVEMRAEKTGHWEYYSNAGELDKSEDL